MDHLQVLSYSHVICSIEKIRFFKEAVKTKDKLHSKRSRKRACLRTSINSASSSYDWPLHGFGRGSLFWQPLS